jgi:hypothetical protein
MTESAFGGSLESDGRFCFVRLAGIWLQSPWRCFRIYFTFFLNCVLPNDLQGNSVTNCITVQYKEWPFPSSFMGHTTPVIRLCKSKVKQSRYTPWRRLGERVYRSYSFTTSALDGCEWSASRPGRALPSGKGPPVPIGQEAGWAPEPVWTQGIEEKSFAPAGDRTPIARTCSP